MSCFNLAGNNWVFQVVLDEFYTAGGKASHVLHVLDTSETKTKANEVGKNFHPNLYYKF